MKVTVVTVVFLILLVANIFVVLLGEGRKPTVFQEGRPDRRQGAAGRLVEGRGSVGAGSGRMVPQVPRR